MANKNIQLQQQQFEFDIVKKVENFNATVDELRTGIFAPIEKITKNSTTYKKFVEAQEKRMIETSWGNVIIHKQILTQVHKDILDCIFVNANETKKVDGGIIFCFSAKKVLKEYGYKDPSTKWLDKKLLELETASIELQQNNGNKYRFKIITSSGYSEEHDSFIIKLSNEYIDFFDKSTIINYKQELSKLLKVDSPLLKAIIRFFWTHNESKMSIVTEPNGKKGLLETIGFPTDSPRTLQKAKKEIKDNHELLSSFGIRYEEDKKNKISYLKSSFENNITFSGPNTKESKNFKIEFKNNVIDELDEKNDLRAKIKDFYGKKIKDYESGYIFEVSKISYDNQIALIETKEEGTITMGSADEPVTLQDVLRFLEKRVLEEII
jgi:hypothetical protein